MKDNTFRLHLIGRGNLVVPQELQAKVVKEPNLAYPVCPTIPIPLTCPSRNTEHHLTGAHALPVSCTSSGHEVGAVAFTRSLP